MGLSVQKGISKSKVLDNVQTLDSWVGALEGRGGGGGGGGVLVSWGQTHLRLGATCLVCKQYG